MINKSPRSNLHPHAQQPEFGDWRADLARPEEAEHYRPQALPAHMKRFPQDTEPGKLSLFSRLLRMLVGLCLLLPLNAIIVYAFIHCIGHSEADTENVRFWLRTPIWFTLIGGGLYLVIAIMGMNRRASLYVYVLGHELTHAIAILLCGGKIKGMKVSATEGGYVLTNKSNLFIALSPYFIPFWMLVWMLVIWGMHAISPFEHYLAWFYAGFGFWLVYHLFWTAYSIVQERQPDLFDNGLIFSLLIIILLNLLLLIGILMIFGLITPAAYGESLWQCTTGAYTLLKAWILHMQ